MHVQDVMPTLVEVTESFMRARKFAIQVMSAVLMSGLWGASSLAATPAPERVAALGVADNASMSVSPAMIHTRGELPTVNAALSVPTNAAVDVRQQTVRDSSHGIGDRLLLLLVAFALVFYQLLRKHRQLRPQTFSH